MSVCSKQMLAISSSTNSSGAVLDALPYIDDTDFTEAHRQLANQLIQAECRQFAKTKNYLKHMPEPNYDAFLTPRVKEQLQAIADKKIEKFDTSRYEVPSPANTNKAGDKRAWQNAIQNCKSQLGNQYLRQLNFEIIEEYGSEAYLRSNKLLQCIAADEEAELYNMRAKLYELNSRRKQTQLKVGEQLSEMGKQWVELVSKNAHLEITIQNMERECRIRAKRSRLENADEKSKK